MTTFAQALGRWHDFYLLIGGAAATLLGLLFVALSFGVGLEVQRRTDGIHTFVTPTVVHFVDVLVIATAAVAPLERARTLAAILLGLVAFNVPQGLQRLARLRGFHREDPFDWRDWLWYLLLPVGCQLLIALASVGLLYGDPRALPSVAGALVLTLVVGVRNAWDLVVFLLEKR